jgi:hypothetical protein
MGAVNVTFCRGFLEHGSNSLGLLDPSCNCEKAFVTARSRV